MVHTMTRKTGTRTIWYLFTLWSVVLFLSCVGNPSRYSKPRVIEGVPFFRQEAYQCGPSSLAGVLNYWGTKVSPEEIADDIYSKSARGTLDVDMVLYAERGGLYANQYKGNWEDLRQSIDKGYPVIVLVDYGFLVYQAYHYMNIIGYNERGIIADSGSDRHKFIPRKDFIRSWQKTDFWTLLITPEE